MAGEPSPVKTETGTVPAGNGLRSNNDQGLFPPVPILSRKDPEELIERSQTGPWVLALEDDELLPEGHIFEPEVPTRAEKAKKRSQK